MKRTKLRERTLPDYTRGEEIFNMVSHIVGGAFGVIVLVTCVVKTALFGSAADIVGAAVYGASMIILYTMSSIYHGLKALTAKKVFRVLDHCTIYLLIAGTYTPIALSGLLREKAWLGWSVFGAIWGMAALGITFNAIDLKRYKKFSMALYILMGWCVVFTGSGAIRALTLEGFSWVLAGGVAYTVGAVIYGVAGHGAKPKRYMHSVFHLFALLGSILQYVGIIFYLPLN